MSSLRDMSMRQHTWTSEERQTVLDKWVRTSLSSATIALQVGMRRNQIMGLCDRFMKAKKFPGRAYLHQQCSQLGETLWWENGPSYDHAATPPTKAHRAELATNKGGKVFKRAIKAKSVAVGQGMQKQRLQLVANHLSAKEQIARKEAVNARAKTMQAEYVAEFEEAQRIRENHDIFSDPVEGEPMSILGLRYGMCRAVTGEHPRVPGGIYCGSKVHREKGAYCKQHHTLFYTPRTRDRAPTNVKSISYQPA
jgi:hypothetical protein